MKQTAQVHKGSAVEVECFKSCAATGTNSHHFRSVVVPRKMIIPLLTSRIEQSHPKSSCRVNCLSFSTLMSIAAGTRQRQILQQSGSTLHSRLNMLDDKRFSRKARLATTVFAASGRSFVNKTANCRWNPGLASQIEVPDRDRASTRP